MNNKIWYICISVFYALLLVSFGIIVAELDKLIISKTIFISASTYLCLSTCVAIVIANVFKQKFEDSKYELEKEKSFNFAYIESLYKKNEFLKEDNNTLLKENEILKMALINPSGKKMN